MKFGNITDGYGNPITGGTSSWTTKYDVVLSSLNTTSKYSDGAITIDGHNWYVENSAAASIFEIINGTGLRIVAASGVEYHSTTRNAPIITAKLTDFGVDTTLRQRIRISGIVTYNATERSEYAILGFENYRALTTNGSGGIATAHMRKGNNDPAAAGFLPIIGLSAINTYYVTTDNGSDDVIVMEISCPDLNSIKLFSGISSNGNFPADSELHPMGTLNYATGALRNSGLATTDALALFFSVSVSGVYSGTLTATISRLKIDVF